MPPPPPTAPPVSRSGISNRSTPAATHKDSNARRAGTVQSRMQTRRKAGSGLPERLPPVWPAWEAHMDNELLDLADRLCTVAGMIMEDHHLLAISRVKNSDDRAAKLEALATAGSDISKLANAAHVLVRLG